MKRKILIACLSFAAVIILAVALNFALLHDSGQSYTTLLSEGEKYISVGNYEEAVIVLEKAIEAEPEKPDAYITLARAYQAMGKDGLAIRTMEKGYEKTGNKTIGRLLLSLKTDQLSIEEKEETRSSDEPHVENKDTRLILNTDLLSFISTACFEDYRQKYGGVTCSMEGNVCVARASGMDAALRYFDTDSVRVIDTSSGMPYKEFVPNEIVLDNISILFGGLSVITYEDIRTMSGVSNLQQIDDKIQFAAGGCTVTISCDTDGTIRSGAEHLIIPSGFNIGVGEHTVSGRVFDAATGSCVVGAEMLFYEGSSPYGESISVKTDSSGGYKVNLENSGTHCVVITKTGYIKEEFTFYISSGSRDSKEDFTISSTLDEGQIRFVLTWGSSPSDLDSYLVGKTSDGKSINIDFTHMSEKNSSGSILAQLDIDDINGYGPETITLNAVAGNYEYYVKDYTNSSTMSYSGAQVKIYKGNSLIHVVDICAGLNNSWSVCIIRHGEITITNCPR